MRPADARPAKPTTLRRRAKALERTLRECAGVRHRTREARDATQELQDVRALLAQPEEKADMTVKTDMADMTERTVGTDGADAPAGPAGEATTTCPTCGPAHPLRRLVTESLLSCETCGTSTPYVEWNWNAHGHDKMPEFQQFSYKRANHFVEWLNASQGKEGTTVPDGVLEACVRHVRQQGIPPERVTPMTVRQALKAIGKRKYYENTTLIWAKLTGKQPQQFTAQQEEALKTMFLSIQEPFERVRASKAPERRNFLSYSYCLFKFCELLGLDSFLTGFSLLKGRDKLYKQDVIFEGICKELDWQFIPSV